MPGEAPLRTGDVWVSRGSTGHPPVRAVIRRVGPRGVQFEITSGARHRRGRPYALPQERFRRQYAPLRPCLTEEEV